MLNINEEIDRVLAVANVAAVELSCDLKLVIGKIEEAKQLLQTIEPTLPLASTLKEISKQVYGSAITPGYVIPAIHAYVSVLEPVIKNPLRFQEPAQSEVLLNYYFHTYHCHQIEWLIEEAKQAGRKVLLSAKEGKIDQETALRQAKDYKQRAESAMLQLQVEEKSRDTYAALLRNIVE